MSERISNTQRMNADSLFIVMFPSNFSVDYNTKILYTNIIAQSNVKINKRLQSLKVCGIIVTQDKKQKYVFLHPEYFLMENIL